MVETRLSQNQKSLSDPVSSVMRPTRNHHDGLLGDAIDQPVFLGDASRPAAAQLVAQWLRLSHATEWLARDLLDQLQNLLLPPPVKPPPVFQFAESRRAELNRAHQAARSVWSFWLKARNSS